MSTMDLVGEPPGGFTRHPSVMESGCKAEPSMHTKELEAADKRPMTPEPGGYGYGAGQKVDTHPNEFIGRDVVSPPFRFKEGQACHALKPSMQATEVITERSAIATTTPDCALGMKLGYRRACDDFLAMIEEEKFEINHGDCRDQDVCDSESLRAKVEAMRDA